MKKILSMILALTMVLSLAACGSKNDAPATEAVDLTAFYTELAGKYGWIDEQTPVEEIGESSIMMMDLTQDKEFLDSYFPGLSEIATKQLIAMTSSISAVVSEFVFAECESEEDAAKVAEILNARVTMQADGGAWYPESVEAWGNAQVVSNGNFVAMIAYADNQAEIVDAFNALFA